MKNEKVYLTTAINYTNAPPHIGHAYEAVIADVLSRYYRIYGSDVMFLTGTDEHGQKVATAAEERGITPQEVCDLYVKNFQSLNEQLNISNDEYIRTSYDFHHKHAQKLWSLCEENGDIYLGTYTGWYDVREETFVTESVAAKTNYKDPFTDKPYIKMEEESYFFCMSKYQKTLIEHINTHPSFIVPIERRTEILTRLEEPLEDLSISRTTFKWGIPVQNNPDHIMYVWFDALSNYLSGIRYFENTENSKKTFWPANCQIIGKDILWFHSVIWPCMLLSAKLPLPKTILAHGFITANDGRKMSKSFDNVIDPVEVLKTADSDVLRFLLMKTAEIGKDLRLNIQIMWVLNNSELADTIGNLVNRGFGLCFKYCDGLIPEEAVNQDDTPFSLKEMKEAVHKSFVTFRLQAALETILNMWRSTNKYLTSHAPWEEPCLTKRKIVCRTLLEAIYILAHFTEPYLPKAARKIVDSMNVSLKKLHELNDIFDNLIPGTKIEKTSSRHKWI